MARNGQKTTLTRLQKSRMWPLRGQPEEHFLVMNHDWLVPVQWLRRLSAASAENELESLVFPQDDSFDSHWQLYLEPQSHPPRIRLGLALLGPRDRCLRADVKLILVTTHGGQVIKESLFNDQTFFLGKGEAISSFINEHISPKIFLDIEGDLYQDVMSNDKPENPLKTEDCTIMAYVRFHNELEIQPKTKAFDFSRRFTVDWKLTKFHQIIEQINQGRPPMGNDRRLVSEPFQFTHQKLIKGLKAKKWRLLVKCPSTPSTHKHTPLYVTLKCAEMIHGNYGKVEIVCKNERNVLRRFIPTFEDLADDFTLEFFTLDELGPNIYSYRHDFNENNGRFFTTEYLLFSVQIVQVLQPADVPRTMKRIPEPTIISLVSKGKLQSKGPGQLLRSTSREQRAPSVMRVETNQRISSVFRPIEKTRIFNPRAVSRENTSVRVSEPPMALRDPFAEESTRSNLSFPPITSRNQVHRSSPEQVNHSPSRLQMSMLPNMSENPVRSPPTFPRSQTRFQSHSRLRSWDHSNPTESLPSRLPSAQELPDNFTFLANLFRSGLHSDVVIHSGDRQWNLHKSILSSRSIYFNQYFATCNDAELDLSNDPQTPSSDILDRIFLFLYTNQYTSMSSAQRSPSSIAEKKSRGRSRRSSIATQATATIAFDTTRLLFDGAIHYGIDPLTLLCLQDMCHPQNVTSHSAAVLLTCLHQATTGSYEKFHGNEYFSQTKNLKQLVLRFIHLHSREVLVSAEWKQLDKRYPSLVHDVLEFVVFEKIDE